MKSNKTMGGDMTNLKLYIWENVLCDYIPGMVTVLAESEEQAWELIKQKDFIVWEQLRGGGDEK